MTEKIYEKLAKHLDNLPGGFPPTKSGVELRILRRLFTPEEAKLALRLIPLPEDEPPTTKTGLTNPVLSGIQRGREKNPSTRKAFMFFITCTPTRRIKAFMEREYGIIGVDEMTVGV